MRRWKELKNEAFTQEEIDAAYEAVIDELRSRLQAAEEALRFYEDLPKRDTAFEDWYDDDGQRARDDWLEEKSE